MKRNILVFTATVILAMIARSQDSSEMNIASEAETPSEIGAPPSTAPELEAGEAPEFDVSGRKPLSRCTPLKIADVYRWSFSSFDDGFGEQVRTTVTLRGGGTAILPIAVSIDDLKEGAETCVLTSGEKQ